MTAGTTDSAQGDAPETPLMRGQSGIGVVDDAIARVFDDVGGQPIIAGGIAAQAKLDAVDTLVVDALNSYQAGAPDTMAALIATIAQRYLREGVIRAMKVLGAVVAHRRGGVEKPGEDVDLPASVRATEPVEERLAGVRQACLARDFLSATLRDDGAGLVSTLKDLKPEDFGPVLLLLVTYTAGLLDASVDIRTQVEAALGHPLCATQP